MSGFIAAAIVAVMHLFIAFSLFISLTTLLDAGYHGGAMGSFVVHVMAVLYIWSPK